jgi:hypothetical protein
LEKQLEAIRIGPDSDMHTESLRFSRRSFVSSATGGHRHKDSLSSGAGRPAAADEVVETRQRVHDYSLQQRSGSEAKLRFGGKVEPRSSDEFQRLLLDGGSATVTSSGRSSTEIPAGRASALSHAQSTATESKRKSLGRQSLGRRSTIEGRPIYTPERTFNFSYPGDEQDDSAAPYPMAIAATTGSDDTFRNAGMFRSDVVPAGGSSIPLAIAAANEDVERPSSAMPTEIDRRWRSSRVATSALGPVTLDGGWRGSQFGAALGGALGDRPSTADGVETYARRGSVMESKHQQVSLTNQLAQLQRRLSGNQEAQGQYVRRLEDLQAALQTVQAQQVTQQVYAGACPAPVMWFSSWYFSVGYCQITGDYKTSDCLSFPGN